MSNPSMTLRSEAAELSRRERSEGWLQIALGVPFAAASLAGMSLLLFALLWLLGVPALAALGIGAGVTLVAMVVDTLCHPDEQWRVARYRLCDGRHEGPSDVSNVLALAGFVPTGLGGMPLNASVSDPQNLAAHGGMLTSACANIVLGGPRQIRRGMTKLALARLRSDSRVLGESEMLLAWVAKEGPVEQSALAEEAGRHRWLGGLALVLDVNALRWTLEGGVKRAVVRET